MEIVSGEVINLSNHPRQDREPSWSGDGREIAFVSNLDWNDHIYRMAVDGTGPRQDCFFGFSNPNTRMRERNRSSFMPNKAAAPFGP